MNCAGTCEQEKHVQRHSGRGESVRLEEYQGCHVATADWVRQRMLGQKGQLEVWLEGSFRASKAVMRPLHLILSERAPLEGVQQSSHNL